MRTLTCCRRAGVARPARAARESECCTCPRRPTDSLCRALGSLRVRSLAHPSVTSLAPRVGAQAATSEVKFFERLEPQQHRELCRVIKYDPVPKDTVLFRQGDEGSTFYIVFRGAVKVYVSGSVSRLGLRCRPDRRAAAVRVGSGEAVLGRMTCWDTTAGMHTGGARSWDAPASVRITLLCEMARALARCHPGEPRGGQRKSRHQFVREAPGHVRRRTRGRRLLR